MLIIYNKISKIVNPLKFKILSLCSHTYFAAQSVFPTNYDIRSILHKVKFIHDDKGLSHFSASENCRNKE